MAFDPDQYISEKAKVPGGFNPDQYLEEKSGVTPVEASVWSKSPEARSAAGKSLREKLSPDVLFSPENSQAIAANVLIPGAAGALSKGLGLAGRLGVAALSGAGYGSSAPIGDNEDLSIANPKRQQNAFVEAYLVRLLNSSEKELVTLVVRRLTPCLMWPRVRHLKPSTQT
jgi:hypothetical protein